MIQKMIDQYGGLQGRGEGTRAVSNIKNTEIVEYKKAIEASPQINKKWEAWEWKGRVKFSSVWGICRRGMEFVEMPEANGQIEWC